MSPADIAAIRAAHAEGSGPSVLYVLQALAQRSLWTAGPLGFAYPRHLSFDPERGAGRVYSLHARAFGGEGEMVVVAGTPYEVVISLHHPRSHKDIDSLQALEEVTKILDLEGDPTFPLTNCHGSRDGSATWTMTLKVRDP